MSLEKHTDDQTPVSPPKEEKRPQSKPVIVYIMILFIAAFLLMALSFLMHQRSNSEALGELQDSVTAMQEVQANQEQIIDLQKQLADAEDEINAMEETHEQELQAQQDALKSRELELKALMDLYRLQQAYSNQNYELCQKIISEMETSGLVNNLPTAVSSNEPVTPPNVRFEQFKEAVEAILAESSFR